MSDLATAGRLRQSTTQFPVSWYCDPRVLEAEQRFLLSAGPGYVGHELMVPEPGDFQVLAARSDAQMLVRNAQGVELLSNICRHRQAIMLNGRGNVPNIVCPLHRWTYDLKGELLGAPHFADKPCASLARTPLQNWNGLLFDGPRDVARDLAALGVKNFDFAGYMLDRVEMHRVNYNWKSFIEVYLEDYHVGPVPSGARPVRHLRRPEVGVRRLRIRCRRSASTTSWPSPERARTSAGTRRCSISTAAKFRSTARSG